MDNFAAFGRILILVGIGIAVVGGAMWLFSRFTGINQMPGTIKIEGSGFTCLFPILGSIVISILLTIVLNVIVRLLNK